ncbi:unnamed protein product, partial [Allacma fusca]
SGSASTNNGNAIACGSISDGNQGVQGSAIVDLSQPGGGQATASGGPIP